MDTQFSSLYYEAKHKTSLFYEYSRESKGDTPICFPFRPYDRSTSLRSIHDQSLRFTTTPRHSDPPTTNHSVPQTPSPQISSVNHDPKPHPTTTYLLPPH
ncbi:hypothetical protein AVEN_226299-1 [Araneus ventricosus]|uniref:Uncharacterized protein n=1 Tax=Araneus ventricosus TaxID=182803 RepID=A0A4Y2DBA8_ARAVE|nr:hypothetical protein AVEN_226299-1 [Araneus ventricosus]